jgi:hypothetical protein
VAAHDGLLRLVQGAGLVQYLAGNGQLAQVVQFPGQAQGVHLGPGQPGHAAQQAGGLAMLKALGAVYPVRFMPTGGVTPANLKEYLGLNAVIACGGTWMVLAKLIDEGRWEELAALVREAVAAL